ncbi:hypothetical protein STCU_10808 [Strigomonas culicis]|uniref:Homologous recombination OB-fold protein OB-fold domain-containing protein n=1 Tax=Strigomonas culicis TaxID=28005 RepID=S9TJY7_9TRYP|nr:hypothetical protein STCU_10808 [Strigomonas culicis]|eukprot:EPY17119.1 hypothetical protein STCU_10808 [Strigomonas culicis]
MEYQRVLQEQAASLQLTLTPLERTLHAASSQKVACCGGEVARLVTENSADATVLLRDSSGTCLCALHGEVTSRYPYAAYPGTLLLLRDTTLVIVSSNTPPLLIATLDNVAGLLLPDDEAAASLVADDSQALRPPTAAVPDEGARVSFPFPAQNHSLPPPAPPSHAASMLTETENSATRTTAAPRGPPPGLNKMPTTSHPSPEVKDLPQKELRVSETSDDELEMVDEF